MTAWSLPHLLRPLWLLALLVLPLLWVMWRRGARVDTPWRPWVDPHLLSGLLQEQRASGSLAIWLFALGYVVAVLALAGPAWPRPVALYAPQAPIVVVEDMSSHMLVADLPPSRLLRARLKVQQLIDQRKGGQMGLVAYSGDAFTVAPLTEDAHSLSDLVVALTPDTMPVDGQRADRGLRNASDLLSQAGFDRGTILLLSDSADTAAQAAAADAHKKGYDVDVIGVGSTQGAPLPTADGTFAQDSTGQMRIARLDTDSLQALATAGGGRYAMLANDASDLSALGVFDTTAASVVSRVKTDAVNWSDGGPFLLIALLPLVALGFRRGWLAILLVGLLALPSHRAEAFPSNPMANVWQRSDQRADQALRSGDATNARALAVTPEQRAAADYRSGDFAGADRIWSNLHTADAQYNRGNALAQLGRYSDAIAAYRTALGMRPSMADAQANLRFVEQLAKRQQQQQQKQQQESQQDHRGHEQGQQGGQDQKSQPQSGKEQSQQPQGQQGGQRKDATAKSAQAGKDSGDRTAASSSQVDQAQQAAPDPNKQALADAAERRALTQALQKQQSQKTADKTKPVVETEAQREQRDATEAMLQRVPDDPGALLKRKFALEYQRRQQEGDH